MERFESILVDVDATAAVHPELERAARLARRCGARLTIVDSMTVPAYGGYALPADVAEEVVDARRRALDRLARLMSDIPATSRLLVGESAPVLTEEVQRAKHDLLVRSHARDLTAGSKQDGAIGEELLRKCPCPVLLVGPGRTAEHPRIVGVVRGTSEDPAEEMLRTKVVSLTLLMARLENGAPTLLQTWVPFAEEMIRTNSLDDAFAAYVEAVRHRTTGDLTYLTRSLEREGSYVPTMSLRGDPEEIIPEFTVRQGVDLVVMATPVNGGGITRMLLRRAPLRFLQRLTCSLLAVKSEQVTSPMRLPA
jgi:nucleotide-binding universal stress UspA family protein